MFIKHDKKYHTTPKNFDMEMGMSISNANQIVTPFPTRIVNINVKTPPKNIADHLLAWTQ